MTPARYILAFVAGVAAGSVASALALAVQSPKPGDLMAGLVAATAISVPFVFLFGLLAVAVERSLLRRVGDAAYFAAAAAIAVLAALAVEQLLLTGQYEDVGQLVPSAVAAALAGAMVWRQLIRSKESRING